MPTSWLAFFRSGLCFFLSFYLLFGYSPLEVEMFRRIGFICVFAFFAVMANAAVTITPKMPSKESGCYQISDAAELY